MLFRQKFEYKIFAILILFMLLKSNLLFSHTTIDRVSFCTNSTIETTDFPIVDVRSQTGIGQIILEGLNKYAGKKLILRLHLKGLEHFKIIIKKMCFNISCSTNTGKVFQTLSYNPSGLELEIKKRNSMRFQVVCKRDNNYYDIEIPPTVTQYFGKSVTIGWIDFYR